MKVKKECTLIRGYFGTSKKGSEYGRISFLDAATYEVDTFFCALEVKEKLAELKQGQLVEATLELTSNNRDRISVIDIVATKL